MGTLSTHLQHTYAHQQQRYISIPPQAHTHLHVPTCMYMYIHMYTIAKPTDQAYLIDMRRVHKQLG